MSDTLASVGLNWSQLTSVDAPGDSFNPVLKLTFQSGAVYWLKAAPGGQRIAFAGTVMKRMGFGTSGTYLLQHGELDALAVTSQAKASQKAGPKIAEMRKRLGLGQDLVLLEHVGGSGTYLDNAFVDGWDDKKSGARHVQFMQNEGAQSDLARMIAVDLLLGNFDRFGLGDATPILHGKTKAVLGISRLPQFHPGNFIYNATTQGFLPIDNDMLSPSLQHLAKTKKNPKPTKQDLYRTAILGGALLDQNELFPSPNQSDLSALLGPEATESILKVLCSFWGRPTMGTVSLTQDEIDALRKVAESIGPKVREAVRALTKELKSPDPESRQQGLLKTLQACKNVEGMDYSVFKVRSRFAELMALGDKPPSPDESLKYALDYGMYRDWKEDFLVLVAQPLPDYDVPAVQLVKHDKTDKAKRAWNTVLSHTPLVTIDQKEQEAKTLASTLKKKIRSQKFGYDQLKAYYDVQLKPLTDTDNRIVKAKLLLIGVLVRAELTQIHTMLHELLNAHPHQALVAKLYAKAFTKHGRDTKLQQLFTAYGDIVGELKRQLATPGTKLLKSEDTKLIGVGPGDSSLEQLCQDCSLKYGQLKAMAVG